MARIVAKAWLTLDGVCDGRMMDEWFMPYHSDARADEIVHTISETDAFIYGRRTYEMLAPYWSVLKNNEMGIAAWLNRAPKYVVTSTLQQLDWSNSTPIGSDVVDAIAKLKSRYPGQILIDGSATLVRSLMDTGLIDEYRLLLHPIILGSGERYFHEGKSAGLSLKETTPLPNGVLRLRYQASGIPRSDTQTQAAAGR